MLKSLTVSLDKFSTITLYCVSAPAYKSLLKSIALFTVTLIFEFSDLFYGLLCVISDVYVFFVWG